MTMTTIPARPAMPIVSRELFSSPRFVATLTRAGLIVQNHRTGTGRCLPAAHPQFADYLAAIEGAVDAAEGDALCRALL